MYLWTAFLLLDSGQRGFSSTLSFLHILYLRNSQTEHCTGGSVQSEAPSTVLPLDSLLSLYTVTASLELILTINRVWRNSINGNSIKPSLIVRYKTLTFLWKFSQWIISHWNTCYNIFTERAVQSPIWNDPAKHRTKSTQQHQSLSHWLHTWNKQACQFLSNCWNTLKCVLMATVMCSVENGRELLPFPEIGMVWTSSH